MDLKANYATRHDGYVGFRAIAIDGRYAVELELE